MAPLAKLLIETSTEAELSEHLSKEQAPNRRNGKASKTVKSQYDPIELQTTRDRNDTFEPQLVKKRQTTLGSALNNKVIALNINNPSTKQAVSKERMTRMGPLKRSSKPSSPRPQP